MTIKVMFVCTGNICRSPTAEAIFKSIVGKLKSEHLLHIESAGLYDYHVGQRADGRSILCGRRRGYQFDSVAQVFSANHFATYDWIVAMDPSHFAALNKMKNVNNENAKVIEVIKYCQNNKFKKLKGVPDPYYGETDGFELVLDILEDALRSFFEKEILPCLKDKGV